MSLTEAQVVAAEIERVDPTVAVLFDRDSTFYSQIEKGQVEIVSKRDMRVPLEMRPGGNFGGFLPDGGDLGLGDAPSYDKGLLPTVDMRIAIQWNKQTEWSTDDKRKAVINTFQRNMASAMAEFRRQVDSQCMTDGTGTLGTITTVGTSGANDVYTLTTDGFGARLMRYGQKVNVYATGLGTRRTTGEGAKILFYDLPNKQIQVLTADVTAAVATDKLVVSGPTTTPPVWLLGVPYHHNSASTGSWLGLDRATNPEIRANRVTASTGFALPFARLAMNKIGDRVGLDNTYDCEAWMHPCQIQAYEEYGQSISIINKDGMKEQGLNQYFSDNMQMAGAPVKKSFSWDKTRIDFICKSIWKRAEMHKAGFYKSSDGRRMFELRGSSGGVAAADIFYLCVSFNLYVTNPAACAYISDLTVPSGY